MLDNKVYEILKWLALIALPALATLVSVILPLWNIVDEGTTTAIVGTITALSTFLGTLLGVSTMKYRKNQ
jgi:hypothetical protein